MPNKPAPINFELLRVNMRKSMVRMGWNASTLAEKCGIPQPTVTRFLSRSTDSLRLDNLQMIAFCLKTSVGALLGEVPLEADEDSVRVVGAMKVMSKHRLRTFADVAEIFVNIEPEARADGRAVPAMVPPKLRG